MVKEINTNGGVYVGGNVNASKGFVGRNSSDKEGTIDEDGFLLSAAFVGGTLTALGQRWRLKQPVEKRNNQFVYVVVE